VILATPAFASAALLGEDRELAQLLRSIRYVSTATVSLAYARSGFPHPLDGFGFVVAGEGPAGFMACTWTSTKFPHRAPEDFVLLRCFIGGARAEAVAGYPEEALIRLVREGLRSAMGITQEPALKKIYRWIKANPQYEVGHPQWLESVSKRLSDHPGLFVAGAAYHGVGVPDCIRSGTLAAEAASGYLNRTRT
jgi:oxygen-dependent protoporphyrinogen oxidase